MPKFRYDRVAVAFIAQLRAALHNDVPSGKTLVVTITAPIRFGSKTASEFETRIRWMLQRPSGKFELHAAINGNQVAARIVDARVGKHRVIGFVHNPEPDRNIVLSSVEAVLRELER